MVWLLRLALGVGLTFALGSAPANAAGDDIAVLVASAAVAHNVSPQWMVRVAWCESRFDPFAVSPDGSNLGLFQLNRHGLLPAFYARGYDNPFDPAQSANFAAERFAAGESGAWSCA